MLPVLLPLESDLRKASDRPPHAFNLFPLLSLSTACRNPRILQVSGPSSARSAFSTPPGFPSPPAPHPPSSHMPPDGQACPNSSLHPPVPATPTFSPFRLSPGRNGSGWSQYEVVKTSRGDMSSLLSGPVVALQFFFRFPPQWSLPSLTTSPFTASRSP